MITEAILHFLGSVSFRIENEDYDLLIWLDDSPKPTKEQIEDWVSKMPAILLNKKRIDELKKLLEDSDWTQLADVKIRMGSEYVDLWAQKRTDWYNELAMLSNGGSI